MLAAIILDLGLYQMTTYDLFQQFNQFQHFQHGVSRSDYFCSHITNSRKRTGSQTKLFGRNHAHNITRVIRSLSVQSQKTCFCFALILVLASSSCSVSGRRIWSFSQIHRSRWSQRSMEKTQTTKRLCPILRGQFRRPENHESMGSPNTRCCNACVTMSALILLLFAPQPTLKSLLSTAPPMLSQKSPSLLPHSVILSSMYWE